MKDDLVKAKVRELTAAARELVDAVYNAKVAAAFDEHGNGPEAGLCDGMLGFGEGRIRRAAKRVGSLLLDLERLDS